MSSLSVVYDGAEIYGKVSVARCWHEMHAWGALDSLSITFGDARSLWDGWAPAAGDAIEVSDGAARTGRMYVRDVARRSSAVTLRAYPAPQSLLEQKCRSWESVQLLQLLGQIASEAAMAYECYGVANHLYAYVEQRNESDLAFLSRRLTYEGASLVVYDGRLIAYSGVWAESQAAAKAIVVVPGNDYELDDAAGRAYGSCLVTDGLTEGRFAAGPGRQLKRIVADRISDAAEAERFACGLLREANRSAATMRIRTDSLLREWAAGSPVDVRCTAAPSWSGPGIVSRLRHDYFGAKSKIWINRPLRSY